MGIGLVKDWTGKDKDQFSLQGQGLDLQGQGIDSQGPGQRQWLKFGP